MSHNNNPIDIVITWVDGSDPTLAAKRNKFLAKEGRTPSDPGAIPTRFASNNEIRYCLLSIFKFAPFVRRVFIVTDGQDPDILEEVSKYFPSRLNDIRIVDHTEIFRGYEEFLPTFNSTSIESMLWQIEGLSENFVYFNDDVILIRDVEPTEWFVNGSPVLRGKWLFPPYKKKLVHSLKIAINRYLLNHKQYQPRLSFYTRQWHAAKLLGFTWRYFFHCHDPHPMNRESLANFFETHNQTLANNLEFRFRNYKQYISIALANHLQILEGNKNFAKQSLGYFHPYYSKARIKRKIERCNSDPKIKSICTQSIDMLSEDVRALIFGWLNEILNLETQPQRKPKVGEVNELFTK